MHAYNDTHFSKIHNAIEEEWGVFSGQNWQTLPYQGGAEWKDNGSEEEAEAV